MSSDSGSPTAEIFLLTDGNRDHESTSKYPTKARQAHRSLFILACILCTIVNLYVFNAVHPPEVLTFYDVAKLRRPNQFIGLERFKTHDSPPVLVYPEFLSQINRADPGRVYGDDPVKFASWSAGGGTDPPVDRVLKVTAKVSTIVEFRAIDYKMENCELVVRTPAMLALNSTLGPGENLVDIWTLKVPHPMDRKSLSWNTRPPRISKVATITVTPGIAFTHRFPCPLNSLHAFELSTYDDSTHVEWTQNRSDPNPAVIMMQYASDTATVSPSPSPTLRQRIGTYLYNSRPSLSWSIPKLDQVAMRVIPWSSHYAMTSEAWENLLPSGGHVVRVTNPDGTVGTHTVAVFHQLRCLQILRDSYLDEGSHLTSPLAQHCMNYLRQLLLCQMDLRNEPQGSNPTHNGMDTQCYDWERVYEEAERNFEAYSRSTQALIR